MKNRKKTWIALLVVVALARALFGIYSMNKPQTDTNSKTITVEIIHKDGSKKDIEVTTSQEYLEGALVDEKLIEGDQSEYGMFVTTVDGEMADYNIDQSWWKLSIDGEDAQTGAAQTPVQDGVTYTWSYETD